MVTGLLDRAASFGQSLRQPAEALNREQVRQTQSALQTRYDFWRAVYANAAYGDLSVAHTFANVWTGYPKSLRPITLISKVAVDWWVEHVYAGAWTRDGLPASNGDPNLLPYDPGTPDELRLCVQQAYGWANAPVLLEQLVHLGAMLGDVFAEIEVHYNDDDPGSNKVYPIIQDPAYVVELELNARGDVKAYRLAIPRYDDIRKRSYLWGKRVTKQDITTYYDDEPYSYVDGQPATIPNRWGFVPAVWIPHRYAGGVHGAPVTDVVVSTLAEYDSVLSSSNDYIHRFVRQGILLATKDPKGAQTYLWGSQAAGQPSELAVETETMRRQAASRDRQTTNVWPVPEDARPYPLIQNLGLADAESHIARIRTEIEEALPEIVFIRRMQAMDQVTRPGAVALVSQVQGKLNRVASNYDLGTVKLGQMCAAIGGQLIKDGDWGLRSRLTKQQQAFLPFGLDSYARNELDFDLSPRELLPRTFGERAAEAVQLESVQTAEGLRHIGYSDEDIYGLDESGESLAPQPRPGMLSANDAAQSNAAAVGDALALSFTRGLNSP